MQGISRLLAILIAFCGVVFTGIIVAIAVSSTTRALEEQVDFSRIDEIVEQHGN